MGFLSLALLSSLLGQYTPTGIYATKVSHEVYAPTGCYAEKPVEKPATVDVKGYPARHGRPFYVMVGSARYLPSASHLEQGEHARQFDPAWLRTLPQEDLFWLHGHAHDNVVDWTYAKRFVQPPTVTVKTTGRWVQQRECINGRCTIRNVWVQD